MVFPFRLLCGACNCAKGTGTQAELIAKLKDRGHLAAQTGPSTKRAGPAWPSGLWERTASAVSLRSASAKPRIISALQTAPQKRGYSVETAQYAPPSGPATRAPRRPRCCAAFTTSSWRLRSFRMEPASPLPPRTRMAVQGSQEIASSTWTGEIGAWQRSPRIS